MGDKKVYANGRSIVHAGDGLKHVCAPPDVCKTPTPGGPQPVPYVNVAKSSDLAKGTKRVKIGGKSVAIVGGELRTSMGDEPGSAGGVVSGKFKGKAGWPTGSPNVRFEGKSVARFMDTCMFNGNTYNTAFTLVGGTGFAYADDFEGLCPICSEGPEQHQILELAEQSTPQICDAIMRDLHSEFARRGQSGATKVSHKKRGYMVAVMSCVCGETWAATSGTTLSGFTTVAGNHVTNAVGGGPVGPDDLWSANRSQFSASGRAEFDRRWQGIHQRLADPEIDASGYTTPGSCAAAKILAAAASHLPVSMTERFFAPAKPWTGTYTLRQTTTPRSELKAMPNSKLQLVLRNFFAEPVATDFGTDICSSTVASCHTCQELLFMTMCGEQKPCG